PHAARRHRPGRGGAGPGAGAEPQRLRREPQPGGDPAPAAAVSRGHGALPPGLFGAPRLVSGPLPDRLPPLRPGRGGRSAQDAGGGGGRRAEVPGGPRLPGHGLLPAEAQGGGRPGARHRDRAEPREAGPGARSQGRPRARLPRRDPAHGTPGTAMSLGPFLALALVLDGQAAAPKPPAPAAPAIPFDEIARRAAEAREKDQIDVAIRWYRQGARLRPRWDEGLWYLATLLYDQDQDRK